MTTSLQRPAGEAAPSVPAGAEQAAAARVRWRYAWITLGVILLFAATYLFAWYNAYSLTSRFIEDADASFAAGDYLDALVGYQEFDEEENRYVTRGGYIAIERMWSASYSWPQPATVQRAQTRSQAIIDQYLTVEDAEQYIQANTGRPGAPYFGEIYLRLGELYEADGDLRDAEDIYTSISNLFPNRPELIERADQHLERLQAAE